MKNILVVLGAFTIAYAGYYMYAQNKNNSLAFESGEYSEDIFLSTQVFIERRAILDTINLDTSIFEDSVFRSYRSFAQPVAEETYGRNDPFRRVSTSQVQFIR